VSSKAHSEVQCDSFSRIFLVQKEAMKVPGRRGFFLLSARAAADELGAFLLSSRKDDNFSFANCWPSVFMVAASRPRAYLCGMQRRNCFYQRKTGAHLNLLPFDAGALKTICSGYRFTFIISHSIPTSNLLIRNKMHQSTGAFG
jgi:hypothetical protein